jgi:hypothetical protein
MNHFPTVITGESEEKIVEAEMRHDCTALFIAKSKDSVLLSRTG